MIEPERLDRQLRFRGIAGILIPRGWFTRDERCRKLVLHLDRQLWKQSLATRLCFYEQDHSAQISCWEQILDHKPNGIICLLETCSDKILERLVIGSAIRSAFVTEFSVASRHLDSCEQHARAIGTKFTV